MEEFDRHMQILKEGGDYAVFAKQTTKVATELMYEGKFDEALSMSAQAMEILRTAFENSHSMSASPMEKAKQKLFCALLVQSLHTHGWFLEELRRLNEAEPCMREALDRMESVFGADSFESTPLLIGLGRLYTRLGRYDQAEELLRRGLSIRQRLERDEFDISSAQEPLSNLYCEMGRLDEAEILCSAAFTTGRKLFANKNHELFAGYALCRARLWAAQGKHEEAIALLNQSITDNEENYGHLHPDHLDGLAVLQKCLKATNQEAEAKKTDARIQQISAQWNIERPN